MTTGSPTRLLVGFSLPLILGYVLQQLYNITDSAIVGRLIGVNAFAAIGAAGLLYWLVLSFVLGVTQGFGIMFSQRFGAADEAGLRRAIMMAALLCAVIGITLTIAGVMSLRPLLVLLNTPVDIVDDAACYLYYVLGGISITITYNLLSAILRALGNSMAPLNAMVLSSIVNVVLDVVLVAVFHMGIPGVAIATLMAQLCACGYCVWMLRGITLLYPREGEWRMDWDTVRTLLRLAMPLAFRNGVIALGGLAVQYVINGYGLLFVAGMTAAKRFYGIMEIIGAAVEGAVATYVGQNYGAGKLDRIQQGMAYAVRLSLISACGIAVLMLLFGKHLLLLLVSGDSVQLNMVVDVGYAHLAAMSLALPALYLLVVWRSALQGMGNTLIPMLSGFMELVLRIAAVFLLPLALGRWGVYVAESVGWVGASALLGVAYAIVFKREYAGAQGRAEEHMLEPALR